MPRIDFLSTSGVNKLRAKTKQFFRASFHHHKCTEQPLNGSLVVAYQWRIKYYRDMSVISIVSEKITMEPAKSLHKMKRSTATSGSRPTMSSCF